MSRLAGPPSHPPPRSAAAMHGLSQGIGEGRFVSPQQVLHSLARLAGLMSGFVSLAPSASMLSPPPTQLG
jgi:hypothetical protein